MQTKVLNYQIIVEPDVETGTGRSGFYAYSPTLGVADDGDTVEEAIINVTGAIKLYVESLVEDGEPVPVDSDQNIITTTQVNISGNFSVI
ncbi:MAG: type II toxin-antitoxin system HicB family antitoxin [Patescibacteria group bacterium]